jgi:hypothetical protein
MEEERGTGVVEEEQDTNVEQEKAPVLRHTRSTWRRAHGGGQKRRRGGHRRVWGNERVRV